MFSDHSPISFNIKTKIGISNGANEVPTSREFKISWIKEHEERIKEELQLPLLEQICSAPYETVDTMVSQFTEQINQVFLQYCDSSYNQHTNAVQNKKNKPYMNSDKPCFTDECKVKYRAYKTALRIFLSM